MKAFLRYRAVDIGAILIAWLVVLILAGEAESTGRIRGDETFWAVAVGSVASLSIWWRRSHPVAVTIFLAPVSMITDTAGYAGIVALYTLVTLRRGRVLVGVIALSMATGIVYSLRRPDPVIPPIGELFLSAAILAATVAIALATRSRQELIESLRHRAEQAEEHARLRADRLRSLERESIAREMHDALAHRISMVSLHAGALQIRPDLSPAEVAEAATTIRDSAHQALEDLREILGVLRAGSAGDGLRPQPDLSHLGELIVQARSAGVRVEAPELPENAPMGPSLGRTVYRLVQEGLTNAAKHAPGVPVRLMLGRTTDENGIPQLHVLLSNPMPGRALTSAAPSARSSHGPPASRASSESATAVTRGPSGKVAAVTWGPSGNGIAAAPGPPENGVAVARGSSGNGAAVTEGPSENGSAAAAGTRAGLMAAPPGPAAGGGPGATVAGLAGVSVVPGSGAGLVGLAERVDLLGGRLRHGVCVDPRTGTTFDLEAWLPWPN